MNELLPRYRLGGGAAGLARQLEALLRAGRPVLCRTYVDLGAPSCFSSHHAETTHLMAREIAAGRGDQLPKFNSKPPATTRPHALASRGRDDAMVTDPDETPADLDHGLWREAVSADRRRAPRDLPEAAAVSELLLRLGFLGAALDTLRLRAVDVRSFRPDDLVATEQLHLITRASTDMAPVRDLLFALMADGTYSLFSRAAMAKHFVVSAGRRAFWDDRMPVAEAELLKLSEAMPDDFTTTLHRQAIFRAVSFVPFLRGDRERTMAYLATAEDFQTSAVPATEVEFLLWRDYAFPLYETLHRTAEAYGDDELAVRSAEKMVAVSPGDHRAWIAHLRVRHRQGDLRGALHSAERAIHLGGFPVAPAAFYASLVCHELAEPAAAAEYRALAATLDPTSPSLSLLP